MKSMARRGRWRNVLEMLMQMSAENLEMNAILCNIAISIYSWQSACESLKNMKGRQLTPDVISFNSAITGCERVTAWRPAVVLLEWMVIGRVPADVIGFSALISALAGQSQSFWTQGLQILSQLQSCTDVIAVSSAITCCEKGQWQHGVSLLNMAAVDRVAPNIISYNSSISACEKSGRWRLAVKLLGSIETKRLAADAVSYNSAISACEKSNCWAYALCLLLSMEDAKLSPDVVSYSAVISAAEKGARWTVAIALLQHLEVRQLQGDVILYSSVISACEKGRQWEMALALLMQMEDRRITPNIISHNSVISACEKAAESEVALALLLQLRSLRSNARPDVVTFSAALAALSAARWRWALELLLLVATDQISPNDLTFNSALSMADWRRSLQLLRQMSQQKMGDMISWNSCATGMFFWVGIDTGRIENYQKITEVGNSGLG
ncbi:unnamed protein product [Cladocopium goreaui]|uniref:Pentatricopeptide repeat-containing protein, chloroplastic n=1 Tax=Cladocopium goreaui TaxID=2562237 RepID=A0A9P1C0J7_9DINO|nr:unnamed protein product [Cladocopium goreaui]